MLFDGTQLQIGGDSGFSGTWGLEVYNTSSNEGTALIGGLQGAQLQIRDLGSSECLKLTANGQASIQSLKASDPMVFYTTPSGGSVTERLHITGDGKIGINLSNPGDYNNDADALVIEAPSGNHSGMTIRSNYAGSGSIYFADGTSTTDAYKGYIVYSQPNDIMYLGTQNTTRLQMNSNGAFGLAGANYGSSGQVLTSQGSGSAVQWASPSGTVLQTVGPNILASNFTTSSGTYQDSGIASSITLSSASNKVIIICTLDVMGYGDRDRRPNTAIFYGTVSNSNKLSQQVAGEYHTGDSGSYSYGAHTYWFIHSPGTTSQVTYRAGLASYDGSNVRIHGDTGSDKRSYMYLQELG